jgi:hypothetical protein
MRHLARALTLWITAATVASADVRPAAVLALCDVTMKTGEAVEGVVAISRPLPSGMVTTDGFYIERTRLRTGAVTRVPFLFSTKIEWLEPHTGRRQFVPDRVVGEFAGVYSYRTYYVRDVSGRDEPAHEEREAVENTNGERVLARDVVYRASHEMLDYVPVYVDALTALLGACQAAPSGPRAEETRILLADMTRFTVVHRPSPERLAGVRAAVTEWARSVMDTDVEHCWPVWFHHIVGPDAVSEWEFREWGM